METIDSDTINTNEQEPTKRPTFLTVLCVLTFISTGLGCFVSLLVPLMGNTILEMLQSSPSYDEVKMADNIKVLQAGWEYYAPSFLLALISLVGAILMWRLKKIGFHLYAAANLALLFIPTLILGLSINIGGIAITLGFIVMYGVNMKHLS